MTPEEYNQKSKELKEEMALKQSLLDREYAFSNNYYIPGDIIEDHIGKIKIDRVKFTGRSENKLPECVYIGTVLKKDGIPTKKHEIRKAWQSNLINKS